LAECTNWKHLNDGITTGSTPTIHILFPTNAQFETYDVIAVFSNNNKQVDVYGYQLKEGDDTTQQEPLTSFARSFLVRGKPPKKPRVSAKEWQIPCGDVIDNFFGESGKFWTPQAWKALEKKQNIMRDV
jgi:hypothetical protein